MCACEADGIQGCPEVHTTLQVPETVLPPTLLMAQKVCGHTLGIRTEDMGCKLYGHCVVVASRLAMCLMLVHSILPQNCWRGVPQLAKIDVKWVCMPLKASTYEFAPSIPEGVG